jgi:hypothetical protein
MTEKQRIHRRKVLQAICDGLPEIEGYLGIEELSPSPEEAIGEPLEQEEEEEEEEDDDEEDEFEEDDDWDTESVTCEDLEVGVDLFLTHLVDENIIRKQSNRLPSFSQVFAKFFGPKHRITKVAEAFQEDIEGYFGAMRYDYVAAAREDLVEIRHIVEQELSTLNEK